MNVFLAPDKMGMGMTGPPVGSGRGIGGIKWGWGKEIARSRMRAAGKAGEGITDAAVDTNCSARTSQASGATTFCSAPLVPFQGLANTPFDSALIDACT